MERQIFQSRLSVYPVRNGRASTSPLMGN
jgi:hypothetical protein